MQSRYADDFRNPRHRRRGTDRSPPPRTRYGWDYAPPGGRYFSPLPGAQGYPEARWGWNPISWMMWPGPGAAGYDLEEFYQAPRRPPRESPTFGRGGDRAARRWSQHHGYEIEGTIRPRHRSQRKDFP